MGCTLREISDQVCREMPGELTEDYFNTFYIGFSKKFSEIFNDVLGLKEEMKRLKVNNNYCFQSEADVQFIKKIMSEYSNPPLKSLRKAELDKVGDDFLVFIYEGVQHLFLGDEGKVDITYARMFNELNNRLGYFDRKKEMTIKSVTDKITDLVKNHVNQYEHFGVGDMQVWLEGIEGGIEAFASLWREVRWEMSALRVAEMNDLQDREYQRIEENQVITQEDLAMEINLRYNMEEEKQELSAKYEKIRAKHNSKFLDNKGPKAQKPFISDIIKDLNKNDILNKMSVLDKNVHEDVINEFEKSGKVIQDIPVELMTPEELILQATDRVVDRREAEKNVKPVDSDLVDKLINSIIEYNKKQ